MTTRAPAVLKTIADSSRLCWWWFILELIFQKLWRSLFAKVLNFATEYTSVALLWLWTWIARNPSISHFPQVFSKIRNLVISCCTPQLWRSRAFDWKMGSGGKCSPPRYSSLVFWSWAPIHRYWEAVLVRRLCCHRRRPGPGSERITSTGGALAVITV